VVFTISDAAGGVTAARLLPLASITGRLHAGDVFFLNGSGSRALRLSFSSLPGQDRAGVQRLAEAVRERSVAGPEPVPERATVRSCDGAHETSKRRTRYTELNELRIADRKHIGLAEMLKGGVIMDVTTPSRPRSRGRRRRVMALERVPSDIRKQAGRADVAVRKIQESRSRHDPVMAKAPSATSSRRRSSSPRVDYIDESEVLTPADEHYHIDKFAFRIPFVCGARSRQALGASARAPMIRTKARRAPQHRGGVRHMRAVISACAVTTLGPRADDGGKNWARRTT